MEGTPANSGRKRRLAASFWRQPLSLGQCPDSEGKDFQPGPAGSSSCPGDAAVQGAAGGVPVPPADPLSVPVPPCVPCEEQVPGTSTSPPRDPKGLLSPITQCSQSQVLCIESEIPEYRSLNVPHCAALISDTFDRLLAGDPEYRSCKSSVAAFILEQEVMDIQQGCRQTFELVALGAGDTCYSGWMQFSGQRLHDMHGLVMARRALQRYLYKQLLLWSKLEKSAKREKSIFQPAVSGGLLALKPKVFVHLYLSRAPAGASEYFPILFPGRRPSVGLSVHTKDQLMPVHSCRPSVLAARICCASGSDKLSRWSVLGLQGALLSHFLEPLYLSSVILADPDPTRAALNWVVNERLQLGPDAGLPAPYAQHQVGFFLGPSISCLSSSTDSHWLSLNWCRGDAAVERVDGATGLAVPRNPAPEGQVCLSRICKVAMLRYFRNMAQEMNRTDLLALPTYHQAKAQAASYQSAKGQLFAHLASLGLGKWPQKHLVDNFAG